MQFSLKDQCHTDYAPAGGPGASGVQSLSENGALLQGVTGGLYDLVSWDTRGSGNLSM